MPSTVYQFDSNQFLSTCWTICESSAGTIPVDPDNSVFRGAETGEGIVGIFPKGLTEDMVSWCFTFKIYLAVPWFYWFLKCLQQEKFQNTKVSQAPCDGTGAARTAWRHKQWQLNVRKKGFTLRVARPWSPQSSWFFHPSAHSNYTSPGSALGRRLGYPFLALSEYTFSLLPLAQNPWRQRSAAVCSEFV